MPLYPPLLSFAQIHERLHEIFPEGSPNRSQCVWEIAAKTIFVMLYTGAIEGNDVWLRPDQVGRMTNLQSMKTDEESRRVWDLLSRKASKGEIPGRWFAHGTRESVRDDTIRNALIPNGVVVEREGLATTSPAPRYAVRANFAALLEPALVEDALEAAMETWRNDNLSAGALARIAIRRQGVAGGGEHVMVRFPNGETRRMAPGLSSVITKAVVEPFARFSYRRF